MPITHLAATASIDEVSEVLARDGCVVIDELVSPEAIDSVMAEMQPHIDANGFGPEAFTGLNTKRTGALVARSETARQLVSHPLVVGVTGKHLEHATTFHLHLTQIISIGPDSPSQPVHRDQWAFDFFPFPDDYEVQCNTLWAGTDFTEANGATRVVVGSNHHEDRLKYEHADTEPAEMTKGSVLLYTGSVYHGGGENSTDQVRTGINITYAVSWLRQEENQYLSVPPEVVPTLDDELLKLMGWDRGAYALGYVDDMRHPLETVRGENFERTFGEVPQR